MIQSKLQDRIYWGLNRMARVLGSEADAYRPRSPFRPLDPSNHFLRLPAAFARESGDFDQSIAYGTATCRGYFDGAYTKAGDFLKVKEEIWFIADQSPLLPILCVHSNQVISVTRRGIPASSSAQTGIMDTPVTTVATDWPVAILNTGSGRYPSSGLPGDVPVPLHQMLLPVSFNETLLIGDIVITNHGSSLSIVSTEQSSLGWRVKLRDITA